MVTEKP